MSYGTRYRIVDDQEARPNRIDAHVSGVTDPACPDAFGAEIAFTATCMTVDLIAEDFAMDFELVAADGTIGAVQYVDKNSARSIDGQWRGFYARNHTALSVCTYRIDGYYKV